MISGIHALDMLLVATNPLVIRNPKSFKNIYVTYFTYVDWQILTIKNGRSIAQYRQGGQKVLDVTDDDS